MPLIIIDQVDPDACDENFHPGYVVGEAGVLDPFKNVTYSAYGLTVDAAREVFDTNRRLWERSSGVADGRQMRRLLGG
jgi:hypothetical protein